MILNTNSKVGNDKDSKQSILRTLRKSILLDFVLFLGGDFAAHCLKNKTLKVEPFSSKRRKMSLLVARLVGRARTVYKGASEIVLRM